jgi:adenylate cyclase
LTSFEVMEAANISRATLNNYISLGLLPRPLVKNPEPGAATSARQIGYFPEEVLVRLERISQLKKEGYAMADIARQLELEGFPQIGTTTPQDTVESQPPSTEPPAQSAAATNTTTRRRLEAAKSNALRLTIDHIPYPAYMVNYNFEIT